VGVIVSGSVGNRSACYDGGETVTMRRFVFLFLLPHMMSLMTESLFIEQLRKSRAGKTWSALSLLPVSAL